MSETEPKYITITITKMVAALYEAEDKLNVFGLNFPYDSPDREAAFYARDMCTDALTKFTKYREVLKAMKASFGRVPASTPKTYEIVIGYDYDAVPIKEEKIVLQEKAFNSLAYFAQVPSWRWIPFEVESDLQYLLDLRLMETHGVKDAEYGMTEIVLEYRLTKLGRDMVRKYKGFNAVK